MIAHSEIVRNQLAFCDSQNVPMIEAPFFDLVAIGKDLDWNANVINCLRIVPGRGMTGWFIFTGERSDVLQEDAYFTPMHTLHVLSKMPEIQPYLGLPPGFQFLYVRKDPGNMNQPYFDLWFDENHLRGSKEDEPYFEEYFRAFQERLRGIM